jgi:hypothetical protein
LGKIRRIEIRISTRQRVELPSGARLTREWCAVCGSDVRMARVEKATARNLEKLLSSGAESDRNELHMDELHTIELADGSLLICLNSLSG